MIHFTWISHVLWTHELQLEHGKEPFFLRSKAFVRVKALLPFWRERGMAESIKKGEEREMGRYSGPKREKSWRQRSVARSPMLHQGVKGAFNKCYRPIHTDG